jgi:hypothetical protein
VKPLIALLLSLLVVVGSIIPCCLWDNCGDEKAAIELSGQENDNEDEANCSPFAACSACNGFIPITRLFRLVPAPSTASIYNDQPVAGYSAGHLSSFWQPPRFA